MYTLRFFAKISFADFAKTWNLRFACQDAIILAQDELCASAAFISADLYEKFAEIEKLCKQQLSDFQDFRLRPDAEEYRNDCREAFQETYKRTREINEKFKSLLEIMREYISRLDVIE